MPHSTTTDVLVPLIQHADGVATAFELSGDRFGAIHTLTAMEIGSTCLRAWTDSAIPEGTTISLGFQDRNQIAKRGAVTRCEHADSGYRLFIDFIG